MDDKDALMSSSEQYIQKSNRTLLLIGVGAFVLFLFALFYSMGAFESTPVETTQTADSSVYFPDRSSIDIELNRSADPLLVTQKEKNVLALKPSPENVSMEGVVIGGVAESVLTLTAEGGPIRIVSMELVEKQQDGFKIEGACQEDMVLKEGASCNAKVVWQPSSIRRIQNNLSVVWKLDDITMYPPPKEKTLIVTIAGQSTDSKDCIICEDKSGPAEETDKKDEGICDEVTGMCLSSSGEILRLIQPERIAISLDGSPLGRVLEKTKEVTNDMGDVVGRVLNDGTVVSKDLKVLGAALGLLPVMNHNGVIIGRLTADGTVVDAENKIVGFPMADGSVIMNEEIIGSVMPWSVILNGFSKAVGVTQQDGTVINAQKEVIGNVLPSGWVINKNGVLIGGVVPKGIGIGYGCQSLGTVRENGKILNAFEQPIGFVTPEGIVMDLGTTPIGRVVREGLVVNVKGEVLAFVNSEGKAVTKEADILGCLNPDGTVSHGEEVIGGVVPKGRVIGFSKDVLGVTLPDGSVVRSNYEKIATASYFGEVLDDKSQLIGQVIPHGTAVGNSCELLGIIDLNGSVLENGQRLVGTLTPSGTVVDINYEFLGKITPFATVSSVAGEMAGIVRFDGKVLDKTGKVTGCVLPDGFAITEKGEVLGRVAEDGVILNEAGIPLGWVIVGEKVYDSTGREVGRVVDRQVISSKGYIIGYLPESGIVVSQEGRILGRFNKEIGYVTDMEGRRFGRLLPGNVVVSLDTNEVIGGLIPYGHSVISLDGSSVGLVLRNGKVIPATGPAKPIKNADGTLTEVEETIGVVRADGTVVNKNEDFLGVVAASGLVSDWKGVMTGYVGNNGVAWNFSGKSMGRALPGRTVRNDGNVIVGKVMDKMRLPVNGNPEFVGFVSVDGTVFQDNQPVGKATPYGSVWDKKGFIASTVDFGSVVNEKKEVAGWLGFNGQVNTTASKVLGRMTVDGVVVDEKGAQVAHLNQVGQTVTELSGGFLGVVGIKGMLTGRNAEVIGGFPFGEEMTDIKDTWIGRLMPPGVVVDLRGEYLGSVRFNAEPVRDRGETLGIVFADNRVFSSSTTVAGQYIPYGTMALDNKGRVIGLMDFKGEIRSFDGKSVGKIVGHQVVSSSGAVVGEVKKGSFALSTTGQLLGSIVPPSVVEYKRDEEVIRDTLVSGNMLLDKKGMLVGGKTSGGIALGLDLKTLGIQAPDGQVISASGKVAQTVPNGILYDADGLGRVVGQMIPMNVIIDRTGHIIGRTSVSNIVNNFAGTRIGTLMPFGTVLSSDNKLVGTVMPQGNVVNDDGVLIGTITVNGEILRENGALEARILQDGFAAKVTAGNYGVMPVVGGVVKEGIVLDLKGKLIGRTSPDGKVVDSEKGDEIGRVLDSGAVLGKNGQLIGTVLPRRTVVDSQLNVIGLVAGDGHVRNLKGEDKGQLMPNGFVRGENALVRTARIVPTELVVDKCSIVGQVRPDGRVINGKGELVGFLNLDGTVISLKSSFLGVIAPTGMVIDRTGKLIGRAMPDGTVVDMRGISIGCSGEKVTDFDGNEIGSVVKQGLVLDKEGNIIGRVKGNGEVVNASGKVIGKVNANGEVVSESGEKIGTAVDVTQEQLLFNDSGEVSGILGETGAVYDTEGRHLYTVDENAQIYDPAGNHIGFIAKNGNMLDKNGSVIGEVGENGIDKAPVLMYDEKGAVSAIVDTKNNRIIPISDGGANDLALGKPTKVIGADGKEYTVKMKEDGTLVAVDENGNEIPVEIGENGEIIVTTKEGKKMSLGKMDGTKFYPASGGKPVSLAPGETRKVMGADGKEYILKRLADGTLVAIDENGNEIPVEIGENGEIIVATKDGKKVSLGKIDGTKFYPAVPQGEGTELAIGESKKIRGADGKEYTITRLPDGTYVAIDEKGNRIPVEIGPNGEIFVKTKDGKKTLLGKLDSGETLMKVKGADGKEYTVKKRADGTLVAVDENGNEIPVELNENGELVMIGEDGKKQVLAEIRGLDNAGPAAEAIRRMLVPSLPTALPSDVLLRNIKIGDEEYQVLPDNTIVEPGTNTIIGFMRDNVAYSTSDVPLAQEIEKKKFPQEVLRFSPEQIRQRQELILARRQLMRDSLVSENGLSRISPSKRLLARSKEKMTANFGENSGTVSSWPIKMDRMIMKGKAIPAVLQTSIDSRYVDVPVTAVVERNVYAETGRVIIIPAGSRLVGRAEGGAGINRVAKVNISWERLVRPDGAFFDLNGSKSGDAQGRGGVAGYLDTNFLTKYGKPILQSALTSLVSFLVSVDEAVSQSTNGSGGESTVSSDKAEAAQDARENFINGMEQVFDQMINDSSNVPPVVFIPSGTRLTVYAQKDLWLRSEEDDVSDADKEFGEESKIASTPPSAKGGHKDRPFPQPISTQSATEGDVVYSGEDDVVVPVDEGEPSDYVEAESSGTTGGTSASSGSNLLTLEQLYQSDSGVNSFPANTNTTNTSAPLEKQGGSTQKNNLF